MQVGIPLRCIYARPHMLQALQAYRRRKPLDQERELPSRVEEAGEQIEHEVKRATLSALVGLI
ncbi:MAG TPA: hypothetical protein VFA09_15945 [Ktedonobacteraceae bacterium]|jgi:hypothetical protein|nr:hypothetical protein [Ktedonobacteraceae bacterium]